MYVLGLTTMGESAAALLRDGQIVACAEEERFSRKKHHIGFPYHSVRYCLAEAGIDIGDVAHVTHYWKPWVLGHRVGHTLTIALRNFKLFQARAKRGTQQVRGHYLPMFYMPFKVRRDFGGGNFRFHYVDHHVSHAASAFYVSPFEEAAVLTVDGTGEDTTVLFAHGRGNDLKVLRRIKLPHSLGQFYSAVTNFLGFDMFAGDEYKVMGMAGWGEPTFHRELARNIVVCDAPGSFKLDIDFLDHHLAKHHQYSDRAIKLFGAPRQADEDVTQRHYDIAASVQKTFEETLFSLLRWLYDETKTRNLCMAGGCALNSLANGKITANTPFENLYFQPAAHDGGGALGSALYVRHAILGAKRNGTTMQHAYLGPGFTEAECRAAAEQKNLIVDRFDDGELERVIAQRIADGDIIAWFQGRMEWGPRALGHRSFLADPRRADMKETINRKIKLREPFRPFAPSMLAEASERYFGRKHDAPFMITVFPVLEARKKEIPAVVHVDGTARPQLVERSINPRYWQLIKEFENLTGIPVLLNTSFNVQEPIVCTPSDAVNTFSAIDVEYLVMENLVVSRNRGTADKLKPRG
jgi:carbamoyltransferase